MRVTPFFYFYSTLRHRKALISVREHNVFYWRFCDYYLGLAARFSYHAQGILLQHHTCRWPLGHNELTRPLTCFAFCPAVYARHYPHVASQVEQSVESPTTRPGSRYTGLYVTSSIILLTCFDYPQKSALGYKSEFFSHFTDGLR